MSKTYEMQWDCEFCDTKHLLGKTHRFCPSCGATQNPDHRYFPSEEKKIAVEDHDYIGEDKQCPSCDHPNSAKAKCCVNCGSPLDAAKKVNLKSSPSLLQESAPDSSLLLSSQEDPSQINDEIVEETKKTTKKTKSKLPWFIGIAVIVLISVVMFSLKTEKEAVVTGNSWERSIDLERYQAVEKEDWEDKIPRDAAKNNCRSKERSTKKVASGQECQTVKNDNGDGTYQEKNECKPTYSDEAIYSQWCTYNINVWNKFDTVVKKGDNIDNIKWPTTNIRECSIQALNCEREGAKKERHLTHFRDSEGKEHSCDFPFNKWKNIKDGTRKSLQFSTFTGKLDCSSF